jgi:hypothetical protein
MNKGGIAIGHGARADSTSVAIGAGALAGSPIPIQAPPVKRLFFTQEQTNSLRDDAPHAVRLVIQTNVRIQPVFLVVSCTSVVKGATFNMAGTNKFKDDRPNFAGNNYEVRFANEFKPETPIVVLLMSAQPITVLDVREGP